MNEGALKLDEALAAGRRYVVDASSRRETRPALEQLRRADPASLGELVERLLTSQDSADRALAVLLAPHLAGGKGLEVLLAALESEQDPVILTAVAEALGELQGRESSVQLERLATNPNPEVRRAAAASLYGKRDSSALSALLSLVDDDNVEVRGWAAWALADNFEPTPERDAALNRWLHGAAADSQLAAQVRSALESPRAVPAPSPPRRRAKTPRGRPAAHARSFTVLVASANPLDTSRLALDEEVRGLTASLRATPARDSVDLKTAWALRPFDLLVELNEHKPEVLHFSGHGMPDGRLVFVDEAENAKPVDGAAIASTLETAGESVRVVVLNACFSADLASSLTEHVDVAVGMDRPVGDDAARLFARAFYSALGYGASVGRAFDQARTALMLEGFEEHVTARLSTRDGVDAHELFLVDRASVSREAPGDDIETLQRVTSGHLEHLAQHASLPVGDGLEIARSVGEVLRRRAETGSLFVVGAPGSGKSGAIYRLASDLASAGRDVVVLAADLLSASGRGGLREELGIRLDLVDALASWRGSESAFLIIDALDAARGREALSVLLEIVERVARKGGRWRVIASVRTFDLRHNPDLQAAIPAKPTGSDERYVDAEFASVRHVAVGELSDTELAGLAETAPQIHEFLQAASPPQRDLLRVPFNLRLLSALLERDQVDRDRLHGLRTQLELLDLYWERRVLAPTIGRDARELLAARVCRLAISTMRLQVPRDALREDAAAHTPHFEELLSEGVLVETEGTATRQDTVGFAHHVLFDYAVHRLLLRGEPEEIAERLAASEDLVLLARPSLVFTLVAEWEAEETHAAFWKLVLRLAAEDVPTAARLVGPTVAAERVSDMSDVALLVAAIDRHDPQAAFVLRHIIGARAAAGLPARPLAGASLSFWGQLAVQLSERISPETAYPLRILVWGLSAELARLDAGDLFALGISSRGLLDWAWNQEPVPPQELQVALEAVARSCRSDPAATDALLSRALEPARLPQFGYVELRPLANEIPSLAPCVPDFVARLYETAFGYDEQSEETTQFGSGQIVRLTSTRRQDWEMVQYALAQEFPAVLDADARTAVRALAAACANEAGRSSIYAQGRLMHLNTPYGDASAIADGSEHWGSSGYHRDVASMLDAFENALAEADAGNAAVDSILRTLVEHPQPAAIWDRVLRAAARSPEKLATAVAGIPASPDALMSRDLEDSICRLLQVGPFHWGAAAQTEIEDAVMSLPDRYPADKRAAAEHRRDRFLMCMPSDALKSERARELRVEIEATGPEEPYRERNEFAARWGAIDADEELRARGIDPEHGATRDLLRAIEPISEFVSAHVTTPPSAEEARGALEPIVRLRDARAELRDAVNESLLDDAQAWLSEAAAVLAWQTPLPVEDRTIAVARELALEGAGGALPRSDPDIAQFDKSSPGWGVPSGRIDAARALLLLSRDPRAGDSDVFARIEELAQDEHPAVRWMVAHNLGLARQTDPERVWELATRIAEREPSAQVLQALLHPLSQFVDDRLDDVATLLRRLYDGEMARRRHEALVRALTSFLIELWVWREHPAGRKLVDEWVEDILPSASVAHTAFYVLRQPITHGASGAEDRAVRQRAIAVWADLTRAARDALQTAEASSRAGEQPSSEVTARISDVAQLLDASATELYFGSGAYAEQKAEGERQLSAAARHRFYREGGRILDVLAPVGMPSIAHHLLQTLSAYVEIDPRGILLRVGEVLEAGRRWGYQLEGLAEQEFVRLVERYLASHRDLLLGDRQSRQVLVSSLEGFVEAGWPSARRLLYGLDDMFR